MPSLCSICALSSDRVVPKIVQPCGTNRSDKARAEYPWPKDNSVFAIFRYSKSSGRDGTQA